MADPGFVGPPQNPQPPIDGGGAFGAPAPAEPYITQDQATAPYQTCTVVTEYFFDSGTFAQPVAGAPGSPVNTGPAARIVQLHAPYGTKKVTFQAKRVGAQPVVPAPEPASTNEVLSTARLVVVAPTPEDDTETQIWEVQGEYLFWLLQPQWYQQGIPMGTVPYVTDQKESNVLPAAAFSQRIV